MTKPSALVTKASAPVAHPADPFKADDTSPNSANSTKLMPNTGFTFGMSTPPKIDDDITNSPDQSDKSDSYSYTWAEAPALTFAGAPLLSAIVKESGQKSAAKPPRAKPGKSVQAPAPSANLNPTGVFSTIPDLELGANASSFSTSSSYVSSGVGGPSAGKKRKLESIKPDTPDKPSTGSSISKSLKATVEDFDLGAESSTVRELDAKKVKRGDKTATTSSPLSTAPIATADSSGEPVEREAVAEKAEKTDTMATIDTAKKRGRPKKGETEKKTIGQTARKTRSQGPAA